MLSGSLLPDTEQSIVLPSLVCGSGANSAGAADEGKMVMGNVFGRRSWEESWAINIVVALVVSHGMANATVMHWSSATKWLTPL